MWANQGIEPAALENKPYIPDHLAEYIRAFSILSSRRQVGFDSSNPIALTDILAYMKLFKPYDRERFVLHIVAMDSKLASIIKKRRENER